MMANLWPIILNSIKAKSYTLMILELTLNMIGHRLATIFDSSRASPSNSIFLRQKWWPISGQSWLFSTQESQVYRTLLWWRSNWLAIDWPPFLLQKYAVTRTRPGGVKNGGQSVANHFELHQSNVLYRCDSWVETLDDWPQIGHHFCFQQGEP